MNESNVNVFSYFSTAQKTVCVCKLKLALRLLSEHPNPTERTESQSSKFGGELVTKNWYQNTSQINQFTVNTILIQN